jgi:hypothetical protein
MRWSKLKQDIEGRMSPHLVGRVRLMATRYRRAHDAEGRWALLLDDVEVGGIGCIRADREESKLTHEIARAKRLSAPEAQKVAWVTLAERAHHPLWLFYEALKTYSRSSIEESLSSNDALARSLAYMDRRVGRRRLIDLAKQRPPTGIEVACPSMRLTAENVPTRGSGPAFKAAEPNTLSV